MGKNPNRFTIFLAKHFTPMRYTESKKRILMDSIKDEAELKMELAKYAAELRESHKRLARNISIAIMVLFPIIILLSYIVQKIINPGYGANVSMEFYSVSVQLLSALLIALYLTGHPIVDQSYSKELKSLISESIWLQMVTADRLPSLYLFAIGQIACLTAIARGHSGTLLFQITILSLAMLTGLVFLKILRIR